MRAVGIEVEPFAFVSILRMEGSREINQHGQLTIKGIIAQEKESTYRELVQRESQVGISVVCENGERKSFFYGHLTGIRIQKENQLSVLTVELKTGSFLLDLGIHTRSFQTEGASYQEMIDLCLADAGGYSLITEKSEAKAGKWFLQYQETDWMFLKRLASQMGVPLIAEDRLGGKRLYFGYRLDPVREMDSFEYYTIEQDFGTVERQKAYGQSDLWEKDAISYRVVSREIYDLGTKVDFRGKELVVGGIRTWMEGQELCHEYHLITPERGRMRPLFNERLPGVSLKARVRGVEKTMVQVELVEEENKSHCGNRWFNYATVYSTPDGTGWYCMPEPKDEVRLVFPDQKEENAYIVSSVHLGESGGRNRPWEKFWRNRQNKEILFTPESIVLKNNQGLSVELSDREGIKMTSDKDIFLQAGGEIRIRSRGEGVQMAADSKVVLQQGAAKVEMAETIRIGGGKIYMN